MWVALAFSLVPLSITLAGLGYYLLPIEKRVRHPWAELLRPSGTVGQTTGIIALALFLFLWLYPLRKRLRSMSEWGRLPNWLQIHIAAGIAAPLYGAVHAGWRFTGLVGLGYFAMAAVALSGVIGRFLYQHIPRSRDGLELTKRESHKQRRLLIEQLAVQIGIDADLLEHALTTTHASQRKLGVFGTLRELIRDDIVRRRLVRSLVRQVQDDRRPDRSQLTAQMILEKARQIVALEQQARMLAATQRVFRYWHIAHMPVAIGALLAVIVHVVVVVALGATWFW
jgi:hypothetical protein